MNRRTALVGTGLTLSFVLSGCLSDEEEETPGSQADESETTTEEGEEEDGETPGDDEPEPGPGGPKIQVHVKVVDDPDDVTPISSSDERIADVELISDLLDEVEDASQQKSDEELVDESFSVTEDRETDEGQEAESVMEELPLKERTLEQWDGDRTEEATYVKHNEHILFLFSREFHLD